ncbi:unnamed protein product [Meloidogyne enterolobii]|uniref:Uncharacterized protein n=1 Tax=Meloidogyne enterolobii TaxID=390850 RepID=A0ACB0Z4Q5_MELEN
MSDPGHFSEDDFVLNNDSVDENEFNLPEMPPSGKRKKKKMKTKRKSTKKSGKKKSLKKKSTKGKSTIKKSVKKSKNRKSTRKSVKVRKVKSKKKKRGVVKRPTISGKESKKLKDFALPVSDSPKIPLRLGEKIRGLDLLDFSDELATKNKHIVKEHKEKVAEKPSTSVDLDIIMRGQEDLFTRNDQKRTGKVWNFEKNI